MGFSWSVLLAATLAGLVTLLSPLPGEPGTADSAPLCRVEVAVTPDPAWVGQAVLYRVRILRRDDVTSLSWDPNPFFPDLRAEWLPGRSADEPTFLDAARYRVYEERRVIFAARSGEHRIPQAGLRCRTGEAGSEEFVPVPATALHARELPLAGRPADWTGVVGVIRVASLVEPRSVPLGNTVRISVRVEGEASVWNARTPFPGDDPIPGAELFPHRPDLARDAGTRLRLRRYFSYDLVPRHLGPLRLPEVRVPYFDPIRNAYDIALAPSVIIEVTPPEAVAQDGGIPVPRTPPSSQDPESPGANRTGPIVLGVLAGSLAVGLLVWRLRRPESRWKELEVLLDEAERGDLSTTERLAAWSRILRAALGVETGLLSAEEIREQSVTPAERAAAQLLEELERSRFAPDAAPPDAERIRRAVEELRERRDGLLS